MELINLRIWILVASITYGSPLKTENTATPIPHISLSTATSNTNSAISENSSSGKTSDHGRAVSPIPSFTSVTNSSGNSTTEKASSSSGKSWTFLVGVVSVVLTTSFLILMAVKFPKWYNYLVSYNHHRLQEYQPDSFDQEFNVDMSTVPQTTPSMGDEDDCMVVFEQTNIFVIDDDGFIEDKYIDAQELTEES